MSFEDKVMNYLAEIHQKITVMDNRLINIENDHGAKLSALFDGYEQNTQAIKSLENRVATQEIKLQVIKN